MKTKIALLLFLGLAIFSLSSWADERMQHRAHMNTPLTEPGNDAFGTIQEVVDKLMADPNTDWSRVNLEALRQHLIDMQNFTLNVEILESKPIDKGLEFTVKGMSKAATASLQRLFNAHPAFLHQDTGWDMTVVENRNQSFTARVTSDQEGDVAKIRGLGYIGIIAYGHHHQLHHWMIATGMMPYGH